MAQWRRLGRFRERFRRRVGTSETFLGALFVGLAIWVLIEAPQRAEESGVSTPVGPLVAVGLGAALLVALWLWVNIRRAMGGVYLFDNGLALVIGRKVKWAYRWREIDRIGGTVTHHKVLPPGITVSKDTKFRVYLRNGDRLCFYGVRWWDTDLDHIVVDFERLANLIHENASHNL